MDNNSSLKISYRQKNSTICPVCGTEFYKEELFSGGGRLIAGALSEELRRLYEDNKKFGKICPLAYQLTVCPACLFTAYQKDFVELSVSELDKMKSLTPARKNAIVKYFGNIDFNDDRNLMLGAASYMLAIDCYGIRNKKVAPTFKNAVSAIRAAWLFNDLSSEKPERPYKKMSQFFYKKAYNYYMLILEYVQNGAEPADAAGNMGPDTDKNWGYDGMLYLAAVLTVKVAGLDPDINMRIENFEKSKKYLSRLFGMGKTTKNRPTELLDKTKALYEKINQMLDEWYIETGKKAEEELPS